MRRTLLLLALAACGSSRSGELARVVNGHCTNSEERLRFALERHRAGEDDIAGVGDLRDGQVSMRLFEDFAFCQTTRRGDDALLGLNAEFQKAGQAFRTPDRAAREAALAQMVELFARMNRYPAKP
jgi:hypothetical protein